MSDSASRSFWAGPRATDIRAVLNSGKGLANDPYLADIVRVGNAEQQNLRCFVGLIQEGHIVLNLLKYLGLSRSRHRRHAPV
jgi:hypothetical protein